uniref:CDP-diacylglycerol--glycerol-3-phosphate 3-phosphatidyltransferase n=1 Tax=Cyprinus carpio TaxID=7962 RepID=A0A8C1XAI8_CYPCA
MAAPMTWTRLVFSGYTPAFCWGLTRITYRFLRTHERRRGSAVLLLAPLLAEADSAPLASSYRPQGFTGAEGLHSRFHWMADHVPAFRVPGGCIRILHSPDEFYQAMKARIKTAKSRVVMASLYLGTGPLEQDLVDCMEEALERSQEDHAPDLKVSFLLDYTRGSRGKHNSRTMLMSLLQRFPEQMRVSLYHTPDLRGLLRLLVPERFNETIGVQHIKAYIFDNSLIISGCVRMHMSHVECSQMCSFCGLTGNRADFSASAQRRIQEVVNTAHVRQSMLEAECSEIPDSDGTVPNDTWIFPLVQMKPLGIHLDEQVTKRLLTEAGGDSVVYLTSGYFNLTHTYMQLVLGAAADYRILMASPEVNGFFGAKGVAGAIPEAYVHLARQFYNKVCQLGQQSRVLLHEYHRPDWTFHAKGLWYYVGGRDSPCLTLIGSPNFGYRSVHRDLEAQIAIVTENEELQMQLQQEQEMLYQSSTQVSNSTFNQPDRRVKLWVKLVTPLIKNFF